MRRLLLLRHAKTERPKPSERDRDRLSITHNFGSDSGSQRDVGQAR